MIEATINEIQSDLNEISDSAVNHARKRLEVISYVTLISQNILYLNTNGFQ